VNRWLFRRARLLDAERGLDVVGDLLVEGDRIAAVGGDLFTIAREAEIVSAEGLCLTPGLVDMRVQLREPGAEHMESIESAGQAAAAGGVTTMVALPNTLGARARSSLPRSTLTPPQLRGSWAAI